ncbi:Lipase [Enhygromyxa salina]|uniref:Lipase n=2 Tax=Enhygromyxa salina TaxID=215803 RepID=A0A2S9YNV5_9BACT|nr:Lipase [Enhygromyxa salina]
MGADADRVQLCLSLVAYAGAAGESARRASALHRSLAGWLAELPVTQDHEIVWGPASFRLWWQPSAPALVVFVTRSRRPDDDACYVVIRGGAPLCVCDPSVESLGWFEQEPWVWARNPGDLAPAVCSGIHRQLDVIRELTVDEQLPGAGRSLAEFLAASVNALDGDRKLPVHVVGHGLGGALATVVALWLRDTQGSGASRDVGWDPARHAKLHCMAFAGPTAGNGDFAIYISERLGAQLELIHNSLDHAAALWDTQTLVGLADLYRPHVVEPTVIRVVIEALGEELERHGVEYEQPPARVLPGQLNTQLPPSYAAQAAYQHLHAYVELLGLAGQIDVDAILGLCSGTDDGPVAQ